MRRSELKRIVRKKIKEKKRVMKKVRRVKIVKRQTCELFADPHVHGFSGANYNAQTVGDWVLYQGKHLSAHYRGKSKGSWVGAIEFGVKLFDNRIYSIGFNVERIRLNGEVRHIPEGTTKLDRGEITRKGQQITFSTVRGEAVDWLAYTTLGGFYNSYVRSTVPGPIKGLCSQQYIRSHFFRHPVRGHRIKIEKMHCPRKAEHRAACLRHGLKGKKLRFCIEDLCNKLPKSILKRILRRNRKMHRKEAPRRRVKRDQCQVYADPHVHGFTGRNFNAQVDGDWVLYRGLHLSVHYRGKRFGSWVGQVQWGAYLFGQRISSRGFDVSSVNIDGQDIKLSNGRNKLPQGGWLDLAGTKITLGTGDGEECDFVSFGWFFNSYVRSDVEVVGGICQQQFIHSKFFSSPIRGRIRSIHERLCDRRDEHERTCRRNRLVGTRLINCIFDLCQGMDKRIVRRLVRNNREFKKSVQLEDTKNGINM